MFQSSKIVQLVKYVFFLSGYLYNKFNVMAYIPGPTWFLSKYQLIRQLKRKIYFMYYLTYYFASLITSLITWLNMN